MRKRINKTKQNKTKKEKRKKKKPNPSLSSILYMVFFFFLPFCQWFFAYVVLSGSGVRWAMGGELRTMASVQWALLERGRFGRNLGHKFFAFRGCFGDFHKWFQDFFLFFN
jgi:hypothetical protein